VPPRVGASKKLAAARGFAPPTFSRAKSLKMRDIPCLLEIFLGYNTDEIPIDRVERSWTDKLSEAYRPSKRDRHLIGALFGSAAGLTEITDDSIRLLRWETENNLECLAEEAKSLELRGYWRTARSILRRYRRRGGETARMLIGANLRRSGKPFSCLRYLAFSSFINNIDQPFTWLRAQPQRPRPADRGPEWQRESLEKMTCLLDI
jgi:hypothetical protein